MNGTTAKIERLPAVITAGARLDGELAQIAQTNIKALIPWDGSTLLETAIRALRQSGRIGKIAVVGPVNAFRAANIDADLLVEEGQSGPENVERGLDALAEIAGNGMVVLAASDLPFLDEGAIRWLLDKTDNMDADIVFPVTFRTAYEKIFPEMPRVWTPLSDVDCTGGSVLLVRPQAIRDNRVLIEKVFAARKSQWDMAMLLGLPFVVRFKMGKLSIQEAEDRVSWLTGCRCKAVVDADPRLAADIDDAGEYRFALRHHDAVRRM